MDVQQQQQDLSDTALPTNTAFLRELVDNMELDQIEEEQHGTTPPQILAGCRHVSDEVQTRLKIANSQYEHVKFMDTLEKSKYVMRKESGDGSTTNCHQVYLKAVTVQDGEKAPNINMVMSKDLKALKTVFF